MEYKYFNSNPDASTFKSGKPKNWNKDDSAIRAISCACNLTWEKAFDKLSTISRYSHDVISKNVVNDFCLSNGFTYHTFGKPSSGTKRPSIEEFIDDHPKGTYIIYFANYFICIIDGCYYDVKKDTKSSIYSYWEK